MRNMIFKGVSLGCFICFLFACNTKKEEPVKEVVDKEQIKQEIQAKENDFAALYNAGQLKDIGYYSDDATVFYQNKLPIVGKPAIVEFLKTDLDSNLNKITFTTNEVFPSNDGEQVVEIGSYKVVDAANNPINTGNYMILFVKRNGKYYSFREMSASDMPIR